MIEEYRASIENIKNLPEISFLRAETLGRWTWAWGIAGRFSEAERNLKESIVILRKLENTSELLICLRNLGFVFGLQTKFFEADECFSEAVKISTDFGSDFLEYTATSLCMRGIVSTWRGDAERAEAYLTQSLKMKRELNDKLGIAENLNWLGSLYELEGDLERAKNFYEQSLEWKWLGRYYIESETRIGLCRVNYGLDSSSSQLYADLVEAENLAIKYGYADHLAALLMLKGTMCWDNSISNIRGGFKAALNSYKQALIWALRYNRFMLDEILIDCARFFL